MENLLDSARNMHDETSLLSVMYRSRTSMRIRACVYIYALLGHVQTTHFFVIRLTINALSIGTKEGFFLFACRFS